MNYILISLVDAKKTEKKNNRKTWQINNRITVCKNVQEECYVNKMFNIRYSKELQLENGFSLRITFYVKLITLKYNLHRRFDGND